MQHLWRSIKWSTIQWGVPVFTLSVSRSLTCLCPHQHGVYFLATFRVFQNLGVPMEASCSSVRRERLSIFDNDGKTSGLVGEMRNIVWFTSSLPLFWGSFIDFCLHPTSTCSHSLIFCPQFCSLMVGSHFPVNFFCSFNDHLKNCYIFSSSLGFILNSRHIQIIYLIRPLTRSFMGPKLLSV